MKTEKPYFHPETLLEPPQPSPLDTRIEAPVARKAVTPGDVARHVGVGTMTVSRALHKPEMVSEPLRVKILKAVDELIQADSLCRHDDRDRFAQRETYSRLSTDAERLRVTVSLNPAEQRAIFDRSWRQAFKRAATPATGYPAGKPLLPPFNY